MLQFQDILIIWNTYGVSGKNSAQFLQRYRCIFLAMEKPHFHRHRMYKTLKFLKNISAAKYDPCGYNEWRDPQKPSQILNRLCKKTLSFIIIYHRFQQLGCAKRGRSTGPIFAKTRCPWYWNWTRLIFLKKKKSFAVPQLVFKLCLIVTVSSQIFLGRRWWNSSKGDCGRSCLHVGHRVEPRCGVSHLF